MGQCFEQRDSIDLAFIDNPAKSAIENEQSILHKLRATSSKFQPYRFHATEAVASMLRHKSEVESGLHKLDFA